VKLIVEHQGRAEEVIVDRRDGGWLVRVGETDYRVDAATVAGTARSLRVDGGQYEVDVAHLGQGRYEVSRGGWVEELTVQDPLSFLASRAHDQAAEHVSQTVTAYMPGRVAAVLVEEGASVTAGDGVLVLEAMKMENEIQVERDGVVGRILVGLGEAVEGGDPLFELEPA
jgi:biotin carboxyl carrier protein